MNNNNNTEMVPHFKGVSMSAYMSTMHGHLSNISSKEAFETCVWNSVDVKVTPLRCALFPPLTMFRCNQSKLSCLTLVCGKMHMPLLLFL